MYNKISFWSLIVFFQVVAVFSQQQQQPQGYPSQQELIQGMTPAQMYNPYSWSTPYYAAASGSWVDYLKQAQDIGNQMFKQWDKTGAAKGWFNMGMGMAHQYAGQAQQMSQMAMKEAQQAAAKAAQEAAKQPQYVLNSV